MELAKRPRGSSSSACLGPNVSGFLCFSLKSVMNILHILDPLVILATPAAGLCLYLSLVVALGCKMASAAMAASPCMLSCSQRNSCDRWSRWILFLPSISSRHACTPVGVFLKTSPQEFMVMSG